MEDTCDMAGQIPFPLLQTPRLVLREIVAADAGVLLSIHGDPELMRWFGNDPLPDVAAAEALIHTFNGWRQFPNPGIRWGLERKQTPGLIGTCGLFAWNRQWRKCVVGYELATAAQGQGYMREALTEALSWGFGAMDLNRIEAQVHPDNLKSLRSLQQLHFVQEGRLREGGFWGGQHHDLLQFSLLKSDWAKVSEGLGVGLS
jgi:[ribosomal protein S5]-alanine N-acetyltransferase